MAKQWAMEYLPARSGNKLLCSYVDGAAVADADSITVAIGDDVPVRRQTEIINAWKWLYEGLKSRNLLDPDNWTNLLVTAADMDNITIANRRTDSDPSFFTDTDIGIWLGANVVDSTENDADRVMLENAFRQLADWARENFLMAESFAEQPSTEPQILSVQGSNRFTFKGVWPGGTRIGVSLQITDPDGQVDQESLTIVLPPGTHPPSVVAVVVASQVDSLVHYRAVAAGDSVTISAAAPANEVSSEMVIL